MSRIKAILLASLFSIAPLLAQSPAFVQGATCGINGSTTSCTAAYASNVAAGHPQIYIVSLGAYAGSSATFVSLTSSTSDVPTLLEKRVYSNVLTMMVFAVQNSAGGATSLTLTVTPGTTGYNATTLNCLEYSGTAPSAVEYVSPLVLQSATSVTTNAAYALTSDTTAISFGTAARSGSTTAITATGFTSRSFITEPGTSGGGTSTGVLDQALSGPTSLTATLTAATNSISEAGLIIIRSTLPAVGAVQRTWCTSGTATVANLSCPILPTLAGDLLTAKVYASADTDVTSSYITQVIDSSSTTWGHVVPASFNGTDGFGGRYEYYRTSIPAGLTSVTFSATGGAQKYDVEIEEIHGVGSSAPLYLSALNTNNAVTTISPSPIPVPAGTYFVDVMVTDNAVGSTYTPSAGYTPIPPTSLTNTALQGSAEETVTLGSSGSIAPTITASAATSVSVVVVAVWQTSNNLLSQVVQTTHGGSASSFGINNPSKQFTVPVTGGNDLYAAGSWANTSASPSLACSPSVTWTQIITQAQFGVWRAPSVAAGNYLCTLTVTPSGGYPSLFLAETSHTGTVDALNSNGLTGTSVSSGNVTTTQNNDLILSVGTVNDAACSGTGPAYTGTGWEQYGAGSSHCTQQAHWVINGGTSGGTFSNSFTAPTSLQMNAAIIAISPAPSPFPSAQPVVNIITKLDRMLNAKDMRSAIQIAQR